MNRTHKLGMAALGLAALVSCQGPMDDKSQSIYIPKECAVVKSIVEAHGPRWSLTCDDSEGNTLFYFMRSGDEGWKKYNVVRK